MKTTSILKANDLIQQENPNANTMIVTYNADGDAAASITGDPDKIAQALFAVMHDEQNPQLAKDIYTMVRDIAFNIISQHSPMAEDLADMFAQSTEDEEVSNSQCMIYPLNSLN